ncbi:hypothetical protein QYE76_067563 [Lolium multiflorum]|uniref:Reverse transcriptase domain-containing protein n=1 Tax=Lolium multiflorum TaxID=4521 RepID=A0AAD8WB27_LOLMU|nr:hypothetical protein QYE76_067563 [Lolium multiflorum]
MKAEILVEVKKEIQKMLDAGFIRPCRYAEWISNVVPVEKKDGRWRVAIDFRNLNSATPKDEYPMPVAETLINAAAGHKVLSFMDGNAGYNQIFMAPEDIHKTAFRVPGSVGLFEYVVMTFGLKNAGATYQRAMNYIFHDLIGKLVEIYIDVHQNIAKRGAWMEILVTKYSRNWTKSTPRFLFCPEASRTPESRQRGALVGEMTWWRGPGPGRATYGVVASLTLLRRLFAYIKPLHRKPLRRKPRYEKSSRAAVIAKPRSGGQESLFRHPAGAGKCPEGFSIDTAAISTAIFITAAAPMRRE